MAGQCAALREDFRILKARQDSLCEDEIIIQWLPAGYGVVEVAENSGSSSGRIPSAECYAEVALGRGSGIAGEKLSSVIGGNRNDRGRCVCTVLGGIGRTRLSMRASSESIVWWRYSTIEKWRRKACPGEGFGA